MTAAYCSFCGGPRDAEAVEHDGCRRRAALDPPRFCDRCGNRLDVQVYPTGFVATCRRCDGVHPARRGR